MSFIIPTSTIHPSEGKPQSAKYKITIATNRDHVGKMSTRCWLLNNHFPFDKYINAGISSTGEIERDIRYDDNLKNTLDFSNEGYIALQFNPPWNTNDRNINEKIKKGLIIRLTG